MAYSFQKIISTEKDLAGRWRVRVDIGNPQEIPMFKFQHAPTDQEVKDETAKYIANQEKAQIEIQKKIAIDEKVAVYKETLIKEEAEKVK